MIQSKKKMWSLLLLLPLLLVLLLVVVVVVLLLLQVLLLLVVVVAQAQAQVPVMLVVLQWQCLCAASAGLQWQLTAQQTVKGGTTHTHPVSVPGPLCVCKCCYYRSAAVLMRSSHCQTLHSLEL
jgi:hypothetical protein